MHRNGSEEGQLQSAAEDSEDEEQGNMMARTVADEFTSADNIVIIDNTLLGMRSDALTCEDSKKAYILNEEVKNTSDFLTSVYKYLSGTIESGIHSGEAEDVAQMLLLFIHLMQEEHSKVIGPSLINIFQSYATLIGLDENAKLNNDYGVSYRENLIISALCEWLGTKFHDLKEIVQMKVEEFKVQHIENINHLPPPSTMVHQLFPQSMVTLLRHWMGYLDKHECASADGTGDHNYFLSSIKSGETKGDLDGSSTKKMYGLIQLILEFTNNTLVTGVAHVVYSRI